MADNPTHQRGDTFRVAGQFSGGDYTGWVGASQVREDVADALLSTLTFEWIDAAVGQFVVTTHQTANWPANKYVLFDVEITSPTGEIRSSRAIKILVERDVTRAGP